MFILNRPARTVGAGIGFAKEYSADRKARKAANELNQFSADTDNEGEDNDIEEWAQAIDAAQSESQPPLAIQGKGQTEEALLADFVRLHPPPPYLQQQPIGRLSLPVILPQRRPSSRTRGWVRGYAPVLAEAGVDQEAWFDFLDQFEQSIDKNSLFWAANAAVWVADKAYLAATANIWIKPIVFAVHLSIEAGRRGYIHNKHNKLLDEMNDHYFKPRGLYALIIKYQPEDLDELGGWVDVRQNVTESVARRDDPSRKLWDDILKASANTVQDDTQLPEFAPLVFPFFNQSDENQSQNAWKHFIYFRRAYQDRSESATFQAQNPSSKLGHVAPQTEYASRFSNPNHPARQGLVGLVTGGKVNPTKGLIRGRFGGHDALEEAADNLTVRNTREAGKTEHGVNVAEDGMNRDLVAWQAMKRRRGGLGALLRQDALYLMVVNMPDEKEMEAVRQQLGMEQIF